MNLGSPRKKSKCNTVYSKTKSINLVIGNVSIQFRNNQNYNNTLQLSPNNNLDWIIKFGGRITHNIKSLGFILMEDYNTSLNLLL